MPDFLKIGDEIGILINRITEAWADLPVPKAADLFPEGFEVSESSSPDEWEQHDAFCGKRYDELDCEFLESVVCNAIVGLSDNATSYYLGGICLCDLKNYDGPLDLERRTDEAVTFFAHMSDRFEPSHFFTDAQAAAFRDFVRFVARTRPGSMAESGAKYVLDWLS